MHTIISLGQVGCDLAEVFETNPEYKVKLLDTDIEGDNCFSLAKQQTSEDYEKNVPDLSDFFKDVGEKIIFMVDGSAKIAGASLQILKQLKDKEIDILYLRTDTQLLNNIGKLQDRLAFNVLQEYARSGLFRTATLVSIPEIENILGDMPIVEYSKNINRVIYNSVAGVKKFETEEPIIDNSSQPNEVSRIMTYGVYSLENDVEKLFYPLDFIDDKCYYFGINENDLKTNSKLFRLIKERMREKVLDKTKISYRIHHTGYEQSFCYVAAWSRKIQE
jgi:hypothetical protein